MRRNEAEEYGYRFYHYPFSLWWYVRMAEDEVNEYRFKAKSLRECLAWCDRDIKG